MSMKIFIASLALGIVISFAASDTASGQLDRSRISPLQPAQFELKSEKTALHRSLWHTLSPLASGFLIGGILGEDAVVPAASLFTYGLMIGPSTGNIYANDWKRGFNGFLFRALGIGAMIMSKTYSGEHLDGGARPNSYGSGSSLQATDVVLVAGIAIFSGGILYNFVTTDQSVREYNKRVRQGIGVRLAPSIDRKTGTTLLTARITF